MLHEYHVIYSVRYYPRFHVTAVGLGTYYPWIRGHYCTDYQGFTSYDQMAKQNCIKSASHSFWHVYHEIHTKELQADELKRNVSVMQTPQSGIEISPYACSLSYVGDPRPLTQRPCASGLHMKMTSVDFKIHHHHHRENIKSKTALTCAVCLTSSLTF
jgi:hypothetical protein